MQNRKSAKKCRLKKKAEFSKLSSGVDGIQQENVDLKVKVSSDSNFKVASDQKRAPLKLLIRIGWAAYNLLFQI